MTEFGADEIRDFTKLKRLREAGYYESEGSVPMPEIVADGEKEALHDLLDARIAPHARKYVHTTLDCFHCQRSTVHRQVATFNTGNPVFHCATCCKCHLCLESPEGAQRLYEAVNGIGDKLSAWEQGRPIEASPSPIFCKNCGAMFRCSVCCGTGPGTYCRGCGQKDCKIVGCDAS